MTNNLERPNKMQQMQRLLATPGFASFAGLSTPEEQHEAILMQLETSILASLSDQAAFAALYFTGEPHFYPYSGAQADNFEREITKYRSIISQESVAYLLSSDRKNPRIKRLLRATLPQYLTIQLEPLYVNYANQRTSDTFWKPIVEGHNGKSVMDRLDRFSGQDLWHRYEKFRAGFIKGLSKPEEIAEDTKVFDIVERAAGQQDAEILFKTVELIHEMGFSSIDDYLKLIMGDDPSHILSDMDALLKVFRDLKVKNGGRELYVHRQQEALKGIDIKDTPPDPIGLVYTSLEDLGIAKDDWDKIVSIQTDVVEDLDTARFLLMHYLPNPAGEYPGIEKHPTWLAIQSHQAIIVTPANFNLTEEYRYLFHEAGHGVEAFLVARDDIVKAQTKGKAFLGRPTPLREVFSLFHEGRMPQKDYFKARERFLTARFAALARHEINLLHEAEEVVNAHDDEKERAKRRFFNNVNRSYKKTLGRATSSIVPTGRAVRDFFEPYNPGIAASYAYGMLIATSLHKLIEQATFPSQRREILEKTVAAATQEDNIHQVLSRLEIEWDVALDNLRNFFK